MSKIIMITIGAIALVLAYFFLCPKVFHIYLGKPANKEVILEKVEYLHQNIDTLSRITLFCRLIWIRELLQHWLQYYSMTITNSHGKKIRVVNHNVFPEKWEKCVDYLWQTFDRRENGPYRNIDLQTMKYIVEDAYKFLKN